MNQKRIAVWVIAVLLLPVFAVTGCAKTKELERINKQQAATIVSLNDEIARLNDELDAMQKAKEELAKAKLNLEKKLSAEMEEGGLAVNMEDRGLVVTVLDQILFDPGKTTLKSKAKETLSKVADILKKNVKDNIVYVGGYTDSDPIKHSGFKSNWELSTARATEVVHFFVDEKKIKPERLVACGYGEYHPVASNKTAAGKAQNRRVEIVISPKKYEKKKLPVVKEELVVEEKTTVEEYVK